MHSSNQKEVYFKVPRQPLDSSKRAISKLEPASTKPDGEGVSETTSVQRAEILKRRTFRNRLRSKERNKRRKLIRKNNLQTTELSAENQESDSETMPLQGSGSKMQDTTRRDATSTQQPAFKQARQMNTARNLAETYKPTQENLPSNVELMKKMNAEKLLNALKTRKAAAAAPQQNAQFKPTFTELEQNVDDTLKKSKKINHMDRVYSTPAVVPGSRETASHQKPKRSDSPLTSTKLHHMDRVYSTPADVAESRHVSYQSQQNVASTRKSTKYNHMERVYSTPAVAPGPRQQPPYQRPLTPPLVNHLERPCDPPQMTAIQRPVTAPLCKPNQQPLHKTQGDTAVRQLELLTERNGSLTPDELAQLKNIIYKKKPAMKDIAIQCSLIRTPNVSTKNCYSQTVYNIASIGNRNNGATFDEPKTESIANVVNQLSGGSSGGSQDIRQLVRDVLVEQLKGDGGVLVLKDGERKINEKDSNKRRTSKKLKVREDSSPRKKKRSSEKKHQSRYRSDSESPSRYRHSKESSPETRASRNRSRSPRNKLVTTDERHVSYMRHLRSKSPSSHTTRRSPHIDADPERSHRSQSDSEYRLSVSEQQKKRSFENDDLLESKTISSKAESESTGTDRREAKVEEKTDASYNLNRYERSSENLPKALPLSHFETPLNYDPYLPPPNYPPPRFPPPVYPPPAFQPFMSMPLTFPVPGKHRELTVLTERDGPVTEKNSKLKEESKMKTDLGVKSKPPPQTSWAPVAPSSYMNPPHPDVSVPPAAPYNTPSLPYTGYDNYGASYNAGPAVTGSQSILGSYPGSVPAETQPPAVRLTDTIFISNLPESCSANLLREKFSISGKVNYAAILQNNTGIVQFQTIPMAETAIGILLFSWSYLNQVK